MICIANQIDRRSSVCQYVGSAFDQTIPVAEQPARDPSIGKQARLEETPAILTVQWPVIDPYQYTGYERKSRLGDSSNFFGHV